MRINIDDTDMDDWPRYLHEGKPFTGELAEFGHNGAMIALTTVVEGILHGKEQSWYPDGTLESDTDVVYGKAVGISRQWHPNGQLAEEREFTDTGEFIAERKWSESGDPISSRSRSPRRTKNVDNDT